MENGEKCWDFTKLSTVYDDPLCFGNRSSQILKALGFEDPLRAMHSSTKRYHLFLLCRRHSLCFQKRPTSRGWKDSSLAVRKSADQKKWRIEMVLRTPCDSKSIKAKHMVHRKPTLREYVMLSLLLCRIWIRIDYLLSPWMFKELMPSPEEDNEDVVSDPSRILYQRKAGLTS